MTAFVTDFEDLEKGGREYYCKLFEMGKRKLGDTGKNGTGFNLCVDIDDLFMEKMADMQQDMIDKCNFTNGVRFKTNTINMLEQQVRNCKYLVAEIEKECKLAEIEGRAPNINGFPSFNNYRFNKKDPNRYKSPIEDAKKILRDAIALYGQFFEERDTLLEIINDNKEKYNLKKEKRVIEKYRRLIMKNEATFAEINEFCLGEVKRKIEDAKIQNKKSGELVVPDFGELINTSANDVLKTGELNLESAKEIEAYKQQILYEKPIEILQNCVREQNSIWDIVSNEAVYSMTSEEAKDVIDFDNIYQPIHVNLNAVRYIRALISSGIFEHVVLHSHYTGRREGMPKEVLSEILFPEADGIILQYFHKRKHKNGKKRLRDSKYDCALEVLRSIYGKDAIDSEKLALLDDSKANIVDFVKKGGIGFYYCARTDSEIIKGANDNSVEIVDLSENQQYLRIVDFSDGNSHVNKEAFIMAGLAINERNIQLEALKGNGKVKSIGVLTIDEGLYAV